MKAKELIKITEGKLISGNSEVEIDPSRISTDSRTIKKGDFFIALKGPNFDGNAFVEDVFRKGALGAIVTASASRIERHDKIVIKVKDAAKALQDIARHHRMKFDMPVICVTGSNGKTTVKEMIWRLLSRRYRVLKNEGTKNNQIGVPQTLLKLKDDHAMAVLELGTNHPGEIRLLSDMARPTMAVITNIGPSHLEFLGDLESVFKEKIQILGSLNKRATIVVNGDDKFLSEIKNPKFKIVKFGFGESNDYRAAQVSIKRDSMKFLLNDSDKFRLNLLGKHNIYNALAAIAIASEFGISYGSMKEVFSDYRPSHMRLNLKKINGISIINDAYNSNPLSMNSALEALINYPARSRWVVSGDMLELGKDARSFHEAIGEAIAKSDVEGLLTFGRLSKYTFSEAKRRGMSKCNIWHCSTHEEIADRLRRIVKKGDAVLIKGSRSMRMEEIINKLKTQNSKLKT